MAVTALPADDGGEGPVLWREGGTISYNPGELNCSFKSGTTKEAKDGMCLSLVIDIVAMPIKAAPGGGGHVRQ